jgi:EAL domain-containing protein (putative c-di-GMP-specific phosphodiesterase class I)
MYAAKMGGRGRVEVFVPSMLEFATERLSLDQDLRHAVERGELRLFFQPVISVDSGAIVGCEALVRWQHPSRGFVLPDTFIPLAEETGMITAIDSWVLHTACRQVAAWRASSLGDLLLAVNVSGRDLGRGELVDRVSAALLETGLPRDRLEVEITESAAVAQPVEALNELHHLRGAGIAVAIDDFGTGYSSLSKLAPFPVDRLKIDRSCSPTGSAWRSPRRASRPRNSSPTSAATAATCSRDTSSAHPCPLTASKSSCRVSRRAGRGGVEANLRERGMHLVLLTPQSGPDCTGPKGVSPPATPHAMGALRRPEALSPPQRRPLRRSPHL